MNEEEIIDLIKAQLYAMRSLDYISAKCLLNKYDELKQQLKDKDEKIKRK